MIGTICTVDGEKFTLGVATIDLDGKLCTKCYFYDNEGCSNAGVECHNSTGSMHTTHVWLKIED